MNIRQKIHEQEILVLSNAARVLIKEQKFEECKELISNALREYPHSPEPHNLMGILFEKEGSHIEAMKHFRASYALDPTYLPAQHNLKHYGTFFQSGTCAYDESDCKTESKENPYTIKYDDRGIGRAVRGD